MLNVLFLYNATQTYTNAVYEHLDALGRFSRNRSFFMHSPPDCPFTVDLSRFDAVCVHFSIRLPYDQLSPATVNALKKFTGLKFLFIQDEYDNTYRTWYWIKEVGFQLVFTVVPERGISHVYPPEQFKNTTFVTNLTGYLPAAKGDQNETVPPSRRALLVGYRGRPLPLRYGALGFEKAEVGRLVRAYCDRKNIPNDIAWTEQDRIYGSAWHDFVRTCRSMLGSESGSNVFNWDGQLESRLAEFRRLNPNSSDLDMYDAVVRPNEIDGIMNQVSPRVFEAISARTILVLFEGEYSGVVRPNEHYIPLKKDGSNLAEVFDKLNDGAYVDEMAERAYRDVIDSGLYSYPSFVAMVDQEVERSRARLCSDNDFVASNSEIEAKVPMVGASAQITTTPIRAVLTPSAPSFAPTLQSDGTLKIIVPLASVWGKIPEPVRKRLRPMARRFKRVISSGEK